MIYLDHAASTPLRPEAVAALQPFLTGIHGNPSGAHAAAREAKTALEAAREDVAAALGARPREIVFTGGGSESDNLAILGAARAARAASPMVRVGPRPRIVTTAIEHKAVLGAAHRLERDGFDVVEVGVGADGILDLDEFSEALARETAVVSVMLVNNEVGTVQPLAAVAGLVRERAPEAVLHTDAVQAVPWVDVAALARAADLVAISGHKFGGPKGVGVLVVREGVRLEPLIEGGGHEWGARAGTQNVAGIVMLAAALRATTDKRDVEAARIARQRDRLEAGLLAALPGSTVHATGAPRSAGHLNLAIPGVEAETLLVALDHAGVCAAAGSSCSSGAIDPSPVLLAMGLDAATARASIRLSLGVTTTDADIDVALATIPECVRRLTLPRAV